MKKSQLRQIIKEEISRILKENKEPTLVDTWIARPGNKVYKVVISFEDNNPKPIKYDDFEAAQIANPDYDLTKIKQTSSDFDVS
jgi:hypothetical protein